MSYPSGRLLPRVAARYLQDPENRALFELNGDSDNRVVLVDEDTEVAAATFTLPDGVDETTPLRFEIQYNAYNVGRYQFKISYTDDDRPINSKQQNEIVGELAVDDDFAISDFNHHLFQQLDATNADKELLAGSYAFIVLGDIQETTRDKGASFRDVSYGGSGDFEALGAIRVDPDRGTVYSQLKNLSVFPDEGSGRLIAISVDDDETDASGFSTPVEMSATNSVIEATTNVTEFPDSTGTTVTSATDPNGLQLGFTSFEQAGQGSQTRTRASAQIENKRPIYDDDVVLFLYEDDDGQSRNVNINYFVEQDF